MKAKMASAWREMAASAKNQNIERHENCGARSPARCAANSAHQNGGVKKRQRAARRIARAALGGGASIIEGIIENSEK
jgi:hypothetical protein